MSSNRDYILQKYLSSTSIDETKKKKKKSKSTKSVIKQANLCIVDDDLGSWPSHSERKSNYTDSDLTVQKKPAFKKPSDSGWQTIREAEIPTNFIEEDELPIIVPGEFTEADLRASQKKKVEQEERNIAPTTTTQKDLNERKRRSATPPPSAQRKAPLSPEIPPADDGLKMSNGASAGLQNADTLKADMTRRQNDLRKRFEEMDPTVSGQHAETIYRDKTGKKISLSTQRAELAAQKRKE
ncbi:Pre-mRNA-splicing factor cwc26, partial [Basidiobolus ranarum]